MTAGRGIVHSERTPEALRGGGSRLFGLQTWVALPAAHEETEPAFAHTPNNALEGQMILAAVARVAEREGLANRRIGQRSARGQP